MTSSQGPEQISLLTRNRMRSEVASVGSINSLHAPFNPQDAKLDDKGHEMLLSDTEDMTISALLTLGPVLFSLINLL